MMYNRSRETPLPSRYDIDPIYEEEMNFMDWEENISRREYDFVTTEKETGKYYLGIPRYVKRTHRDRNYRIVLENSISVPTFYAYPFNEVLLYLSLYSFEFPVFPERVDIVQMDISTDGVYTVIIKTFWLRIVQRTWKRVYQQRKRWIERFSSLENLQRRERGLRWLNSKPPSIMGMLKMYV
jgi:hypothetical protein